MTQTYTLVRRIADIDAAQWNDLAGDHPVVSHDYLHALEATGCASEDTGWLPHHLLLHHNGKLCAAMPMYLKTHSRGEYVFDHIWAQAYQRHGLPYYPKLLSAIPFTPVPGPRLLAHSHADRVLLARKAAEITAQNNISSLHVLFPTEQDLAALQEAGFLLRENVQFHWFNQGYKTLDDFLATLSQKHRKKIRQDSKKAIQAGVSFRWLRGSDINADTLAFFYRCYHQTYIEHGNLPYLSLEFFQRLLDTMADKVLIVLAEQQGVAIAAALNLLSRTHMYGRYWGSTQYIPGLHFETCYTQGIHYCIAHGLQVFEGGAQGEHKLSRGLLPVSTRSAHWISDARYTQAISEFLDMETPAIHAYRDELHEHSPFKKT
ncbi:MAG: N-acetyltransferase [Burkholderiaceae bacterium]|nr:N-acetyltransferase [Burkholderiaceae bacterium]